MLYFAVYIFPFFSPAHQTFFHAFPSCVLLIFFFHIFPDKDRFSRFYFLRKLQKQFFPPLLSKYKNNSILFCYQICTNIIIIYFTSYILWQYYTNKHHVLYFKLYQSKKRSFSFLFIAFGDVICCCRISSLLQYFFVSFFTFAKTSFLFLFDFELNFYSQRKINQNVSMEIDCIE